MARHYTSMYVHIYMWDVSCPRCMSVTHISKKVICLNAKTPRYTGLLPFIPHSTIKWCLKLYQSVNSVKNIYTLFVLIYEKLIFNGFTTNPLSAGQIMSSQTTLKILRPKMIHHKVSWSIEFLVLWNWPWSFTLEWTDLQDGPNFVMFYLAISIHQQPLLRPLFQCSFCDRYTKCLSW